MKPDRSGLLEKLKRILAIIEEKLDDAVREREIIRLLTSIDEKLSHLGGSTEEREAAIVALLETTFRPSIDKLKAVD